MIFIESVDTTQVAPVDALWLAERFMRRQYGVVTTLLMLGVSANQIVAFGTDLARWDWLQVSAAATFLSAAYFSLLLPDRAHETVLRLVDRGVVVGEPADVLDLLRRLHRTSRIVGAINGPLCALLIVGAFLLAFGRDLPRRAVLTAIYAIAAVPVGLFFGRALVYGQLARYFRCHNCQVLPDPRHLDEASGLLPVGALYFYQARLLGIVGTYLAVWWFLIPVVPRNYGHWRDPYAVLLAVVIVGQIAVYILPMIGFHRIMVERKRQLYREADKLSCEAVQARDDEVSASVSVRYLAIDKMPVWPVSSSIRRRFGFGSLVLAVPVFAEMLGASSSTQNALERLGEIITGS